ncbi:esterase/lipase family protein [Rariglobus hedericola]|uniref:Alpha/beta fold hydrolase n=1 Tax=Rariglobus hedericola TaxID=2597822 RepID=A0A556QK85_9BACT|nr:alpha/beta fold hydrolase [Rariglobus hedericola]TSJ77039.1 alpha/beta fold hydrolase [Rariglobus hedericola]
MPRPLRFLCILLGASTACHAADTVVLLHGLGRSPLAMARLAHDLRAEGYAVHNLAYPSQRADIRTLSEATLGPIFANTTPSAAGTRIHIVTHSMGGILVRQYLHDHGTPANLGRVVMLAPPNTGSELVDRLRTWSLYRRLNGPAGIQLGTTHDSLPKSLGPLPSSVEVGIIAGNRSLNPLFSTWLAGPDDGKVTVASTHVSGESAHLTVPHSHTWLMWRRSVIKEVRAFLRTGQFIARSSS